MKGTLIVPLLAATSVLASLDSSAPVPRQNLWPGSIPGQCATTCVPYLQDIQQCGTLDPQACLCTSKVRGDGVACLNCVAGVFPSTLSTLQDAGDASVSECAQAGHPIDPIRITGSTSTTGSGMSSQGVGNTVNGAARCAGISGGAITTMVLHAWGLL